MTVGYPRVDAWVKRMLARGKGRKVLGGMMDAFGLLGPKVAARGG